MKVLLERKRNNIFSTIKQFGCAVQCKKCKQFVAGKKKIFQLIDLCRSCAQMKNTFFVLENQNQQIIDIKIILDGFLLEFFYWHKSQGFIHTVNMFTFWSEIPVQRSATLIIILVNFILSKLHKILLGIL